MDDVKTEDSQHARTSGQTSGSLRDARGHPVPGGRVGGKQWEKSLHELLHEVNLGNSGAEALQWRVTAVAREVDF
eukprot:7223-Amphidinium_carterae.1